jgi:hypothetical protein
MGLCSESFGPYFWGALHLACLGASNLKGLKRFVESFPYVLPCPGCRVHFDEVLALNPIPETLDRIKLFMWSVDVHNIVNERLQKPIMSYEDAYSHWMSGCEPPQQLFDPVTIILIILLFIVILSTLLKNYRK